MSTIHNVSDIYNGANPVSSGSGGLTFVTTQDSATVTFGGDGTVSNPLTAQASFGGVYIIRDDASFRAALAGPEIEKVALWLATNPFQLQLNNAPSDDYIVTGDILIIHSGLTFDANPSTSAQRPKFVGSGRIQWGGSAVIMDTGVNLAGPEMWFTSVNMSNATFGFTGSYIIEGPFQSDWAPIQARLTEGGGSLIVQNFGFWTSKQEGFDAISPSALTHQGFFQGSTIFTEVNVAVDTLLSKQQVIAKSMRIVADADNVLVTLDTTPGYKGGFWFVDIIAGTGSPNILRLKTSQSANTLGLPMGFSGLVYVSDLASSVPVLSAINIAAFLGAVAVSDTTTIDLAGDGTAGNPINATLIDGSVSTAKLANNAVTSAKLADNSVTSAKIVDGTIVTADLANNAVSLAKLATQAANTVLANATAATAVPTAFAVGQNTVLGRRASNLVAIALTDPEFVRYNRTALSDGTINAVATYGEFGIFIDNADANTLTGANGPRGTGLYPGIFVTSSEGAATTRDYLQVYADSTGTAMRGGTSADTGTITWSPWVQIGATSVTSSTMGRTITYDFFLSEQNLSATTSFGTRVAHWYRLAVSSFIRVERISFFMGTSGGTVRVALYKRSATTGNVSLVWQSGDVSCTAGFNTVTVGTPADYTPPIDQLWVGIMVPQTGSGSFNAMAGRNLNLSVIGPNTLNAEAVTIFKQTQGSDSFPATFNPVVDVPSFPTIIPHMIASQVT